jgi:hypothetical protein
MDAIVILPMHLDTDQTSNDNIHGKVFEDKLRYLSTVWLPHAVQRDKAEL